ncbi:hypothetical protein RR48_02532 [Papilio machaon]|uniref:Uncharacterized protein n=1 Tax=Papilio machaon TaxID=76193 RepID=A0A0N1PJD4_PAPMA|nr:hypothetical protein RR48_02532 [Papilio machaon]
MATGFVSSQSRHYTAAFSRPHLSVGCKQPAVAHDASRTMTSPRERRDDDNVELLPLKSVLVNNNYKEDEAYYPPTPAFQPHPSTSNLYEYTLLSKRTPVSKRLLRASQPAPTPLLTLCGAPPPSRKREELAALANLRKKVAPALLHQDRQQFACDQPWGSRHSVQSIATEHASQTITRDLL